MTEREDKVFMAKIAEQAERYDEMSDFMTEVAKMGQPLSVEERNLLSVAYKNVIGTRRASWRIVASIEQKEKGKGHDAQVEHIKGYRTMIERELYEVCEQILQLLDQVLKSCEDSENGDDEATVFYYKMKGDYYRYMAEYSTNERREAAAKNASEAYKTAESIAETQLTSTHPIRLGLALNFSVFYYEIMNDPEKACELAKKAFDDAIAQLDALSEDSYKDSTLIMQLLRDNLTLWNSENLEDTKDEEESKPNQE